MTPTPIAFFVSSHGFGHAARSAAVIDALAHLRPALRCSIFTSVPEWMFEDSLVSPFDYVECPTDVGLVQSTPMDEDLPATIRALSAFLPLPGELVERAANEARRRECRLIVSDISPLGIAVAAELGLPSTLIENFTWDWIYRAYLPIEPRFAPFMAELRRLYSSVALRIQAVPFCSRVPGAARVAPISRSIRESPAEVRHRLRLPDDVPFVLVTMGGFPATYRFLDRFRRHREIVFVIPGAVDRVQRKQNLVLLPHRTRFQHADLVSAAELVVGKLGYSTLAEAFQAHTPYLYLQRRHFPESPVLARFAAQRMVSDEISEGEFEAAEWPSRLTDLGERRRAPTVESTGSRQAAALLLDRLESGAEPG